MMLLRQHTSSRFWNFDFIAKIEASVVVVSSQLSPDCIIIFRPMANAVVRVTRGSCFTEIRTTDAVKISTKRTESGDNSGSCFCSSLRRSTSGMNESIDRMSQTNKETVTSRDIIIFLDFLENVNSMASVFFSFFDRFSFHRWYVKHNNNNNGCSSKTKQHSTSQHIQRKLI